MAAVRGKAGKGPAAILTSVGAVVALAVASTGAALAAASTASGAGEPFTVRLTPEQDTQSAGICNEFTVRVTDQQGNPVAGRTVDVQQVLQDAGAEPGETRELSFCNPPNAVGANPTGQGATSFGDVHGNNPSGTAGQPGRNTTVNAEVGPTDANGEVTFGINLNAVASGQFAIVDVRSWVDTGGDNDAFGAGEPSDTAVKTWTPDGSPTVTALNAEPETATNPSGTQHQVTVTLTGAHGPIPNFTPRSVIVANAAGRPQGDVADPNAGASPNAAQGNFDAYSCTPSNAQGVSTCTFDDSSSPGPAGTDTVVFYVNQAEGGTQGPDANEPQDAVQKTWTPFEGTFTLDLRCAGAGTGDDRDAGEQGGEEQGAGVPDCTNPSSDADEAFTATVTNVQGIGQANVTIEFEFGGRTNGNQAGANDSTADARLTAAGGQIGTSPGSLRTSCVTDANGRCEVTLANPTPLAGDTIEVVGTISGAAGGVRTDAATKQWQAGVVNRQGTITLSPRAATNQINTPHTVGATVRDQFGRPVPGADVDFRIAGGPNAGLVLPAMTDAVTDAGGVATFTYSSTVAGTDEIVACSEAGGTENDACDAGEPSGTAFKTWQTIGPSMARFIQLCHGDVAGTVCETGEQLNEAGDEHELTARVTGAQGDPIANVPVQFRQTGPGAFTPGGATTTTVLTDADGLAAAVLISDVEGASTVVAEISPEGSAGGFRNTGANNDECERPGGNCISETLTKVWEVEPVDGHECDDAIDNDGDGLIDYPDDPGCAEEQDGSELPVNVIDDLERHGRTVSIRFDHDSDRLVVYGRLRVDDGFEECRAGQPINVQRRVDGRWVTKKSTDTNRKGRYAVEIFDLASRYRAVAPRTEIVDDRLNKMDVCRKAVKGKRHRHRR